MKRWHKWSLSVFGVLLVLIITLAVLFLPMVKILMGTEGLSGIKEPIPDVTSLEYITINKGDADWICWRGAAGDGRSAVKGIIKDWSGGLKKVWEVNFLCQGNASASWSAPVIQGDRLIVCGRNSDSDLVFCLDAVNGGLIWQTSYLTPANTSHGAGPRATPYIDNDRVYTFGRNGDLVCWRLIDGKIVWHQNVNAEGGKEPMWGHASSPLVLNGIVVVQGGGTARTIAYDKMTGDMIWKSGNGLAGYAALQRLNLLNKTLLLAFHGKGLAALDTDNGVELWNLPWETQYDVNATTPIVMNDRVFITSGYGTGCQLLKVNLTKTEILWHNQIIASIHSDPYVINGFLYGYSGDSYQNRGEFKCVDMKNGEEKWSTNEMGWGTCVFVDGHFLCCDIKGNIFLMNPDPNSFIKVTELRKALGAIPGPVWTLPVVANGYLYLRFKQRLVCYDIIQL